MLAGSLARTCQLVVLDADPTQALSRGSAKPDIVNRLKGRTSRILRQEFASFQIRLPMLWSGNFYAGLVGPVSGAVCNATSKRPYVAAATCGGCYIRPDVSGVWHNPP